MTPTIEMLKKLAARVQQNDAQAIENTATLLAGPAIGRPPDRAAIALRRGRHRAAGIGRVGRHGSSDSHRGRA